MKKILFLCLLLVTALVHQAWAQVRAITGRVVDATTSQPLPGVTVLVKGTTVGTATGVDGGYTVNAPEGSTTLVFRFVGYKTLERAIGNSSTINVSLSTDTEQLQEVVVTALGIERTKNELPYAAQTIGGEEVADTRQQNFTNELAGKVSGVQIQQNNNLGGSTNVIIRGNKSISGNNQALFVVDGVPLDNSTNNTTNQATGRGGYDYGNAVSDINPDDIASMTVLKGAAATALYGSRAANGVVMITTKKGSKKQGIGVTVNSGASWGFIDKSTYTRYQKNYGSGYEGSAYNDNPNSLSGFWDIDVDGDGDLDPVVPTTEDASAGAPFNPNLLVYHWYAFDPTSPYYLQATPWVAAENDPTTFFETAYGTSHSISIDGNGDKGYFKIGYGRNSNDGILPNSNITKDYLNFSASYDVVKSLKASASINYTETNGLGRFGTGYSGLNPNQSFRQWWPVNVDIKQLEEAYNRTGQNVTWNRISPSNPIPAYTDNPYWTRYHNYNNDNRRRLFGNVRLDYEVTDWLNIMGRVSLDTYDEIREERLAVGSQGTPYYTRQNGRFSEVNYDLMANINRDLSEDFSLQATVGTNVRETNVASIRATTNGGLIIPGLYALSNSVSPIVAPTERDTRLRVNGYFASATLGYKELAFLDVASRVDQSSSLPTENNTYYYPSISGSFVFSELFEPTYGFTYGKVRANYAEVGNMAQPLSVFTTYDLITPFASTPLASVSGTRNNPDLEPERTKSWELGLEMSFLDARAGFDVTYYNASTVDQILQTPVSRASGISYKWINAGEVVNRGFEVSAFGTPVKINDFSWTINANWTRNRNEVIDLGPIDNYQIASFQGGVSLNATEGEPFGTIKGPGFVYNDFGQKVVDEDGLYLSNGNANTTIGDINPDWIGGVTNTFKYKNLSLGFLIDVKKGGDLFSLDQSYGLYTGVPESTSFINDLGNPVRNPVTNDEASGGIILPGVKNVGTDENPEYVQNDIRASVPLALGTDGNPAEAFVYDASYVKLREVTLGYSLPESLVSKLKVFQGVDVSVYGRNLWIIHKNTPYSDPEEGLSSGTLSLGYQSGAYPTTRNIGFNIRARF